MENSGLILLCVPQTWAQTAWPTFNPGQQETLGEGSGEGGAVFFSGLWDCYSLLHVPVYVHTCVIYLTSLWALCRLSQACPGWLYSVKKPYEPSRKVLMCLRSLLAGFMATAKRTGARYFLTMGLGVEVLSDWFIAVNFTALCKSWWAGGFH